MDISGPQKTAFKIKQACKLVIFLSGLLLLITGASKVWSGFGTSKALTAEEPVTGLTFRYLFFATGAVEIVVGSVSCFGRHLKFSARAIAWLATNFLIYRIYIAWQGYIGPCSCLGSLTEAIHMSPALADTIMKWVLGFLVVSSYATVFWLWWEGKRSSDNSFALP